MAPRDPQEEMPQTHSLYQSQHAPQSQSSQQATAGQSKKNTGGSMTYNLDRPDEYEAPLRSDANFGVNTTNMSRDLRNHNTNLKDLTVRLDAHNKRLDGHETNLNQARAAFNGSKEEITKLRQEGAQMMQDVAKMEHGLAKMQDNMDKVIHDFNMVRAALTAIVHKLGFVNIKDAIDNDSRPILSAVPALPVSYTAPT